MHCLASMRPKRARRNLRGSSLLKSSPAQFSELLHQSPPPILLPTHRAVHQTISTFQGLSARPSFTPLTLHLVLATQGSTPLSRCCETASGGPTWPGMEEGLSRVAQTYAISRSTRHLPAGKLHPLSIPNRLWSHLRVDFITDLPVSDGHTCILVIIVLHPSQAFPRPSRRQNSCLIESSDITAFQTTLCQTEGLNSSRGYGRHSSLS